jgi:Tfp pilus assembly protein PilW
LILGRDMVGDESGMTLVELLVAMSTGVIVMTGIVIAMIVTLRETDRVTSHVEANQNARLTMTKILAGLHSSCVAPQIAPIREESTGTILSFVHQSGEAVAPVPVLTKISLSGTTLTETDYNVASGAAPNWTFSTTPVTTETLMQGISQVGTTPIFRYYSYVSGVVSETAQATPLGAEAVKTVLVKIAFSTAPGHTVASDANAAATIQDSALLRLTPPGYSASSNNLPCQ